jgi:hypothetical protein
LSESRGPQLSSVRSAPASMAAALMPRGAGGRTLSNRQF